MHKHEKLTKREKMIIIGAAVVTTCIAGYFGYKYLSEIKLEKLLREDIVKLENSNLKLEDSVDTLMAAASEGAFEEALGTVNHKIVYRSDKKNYILEYLSMNPADIDAQQSLKRVTAELADLCRRKDKIEAAQKLYEISNEN